MSSPIPIPTREQAAQILKVVDKGLVAGLGKASPGEMCVEAAVCFALGLPHNDNPPCVGPAVRSCKIAINDKSWSSSAARAKGMRAIAIAQLGSDTIDQKAFKDLFWFKCGTQIQPLIGEYYAKGDKTSPHQIYADKMRASTTLAECKAHAYAHAQAYDRGYAQAYAHAYAHANAYAQAQDQAHAYAHANAYAHAQAHAYDLGYVYVRGYAHAHAYVYAYAHAQAQDHAYAHAQAHAQAYDRGYAYDIWLTKITNIILECLKELKSPGCAYLTLLED